MAARSAAGHDLLPPAPRHVAARARRTGLVALAALCAVAAPWWLAAATAAACLGTVLVFVAAESVRRRSGGDAGDFSHAHLSALVAAGMHDGLLHPEVAVLLPTAPQLAWSCRFDAEAWRRELEQACRRAVKTTTAVAERREGWDTPGLGAGLTDLLRQEAGAGE